MSIVSMVDNKVVAEKRKSDAAKRGPDPGTPVGVPTNVVNQLVAYIPTEIITIWVAFLTVLDDPKPTAGEKLCQADFGTAWMWTIVAAVVASALTLGLAWRKFKDTEGVTFKLPLFAMIAAPAAFVAWAVALPESPLRSACWFDVETGGFIVLVSTVAITTVAYIAGQGTQSKKA